MGHTSQLTGAKMIGEEASCNYYWGGDAEFKQAHCTDPFVVSMQLNPASQLLDDV